MRNISKSQTKEAKATCESIANYAQFGKPSDDAVESFKRKPAYLEPFWNNLGKNINKDQVAAVQLERGEENER